MKLEFMALTMVVSMLCLAMYTQTPSEGQSEALESPVSAFSVESDIVTSPKYERRGILDVAPITYFDVKLDERLQDHIFQLCKEYEVPPRVVFAMIWRESNYNPNCVGDGGNSLGLMQIQQRFHSERMKKLGCMDLTDPYQNVKVGVDFLSEMIDKGKGIEWALMAYNGGASYANRKAAAGEVNQYARSVLDKAAELGTYEVVLD